MTGPKMTGSETTGLPLIDVGALGSADPGDWHDVAAEIDTALREWGFLYIVNHGISPAQMAKAFGLAKALFDLPLAEKQAIDLASSKWHHGWGGIGLEQLDEGLPGDLKESFDMGRHLALDHPLTQRGLMVYGPNQYPAIPGWREAVDEHYELTLGLGLRMLGAVAVALDLPADFFTKQFDETVSVLRFLHYPPATQRTSTEQLGAGAHSDYGCMTLLAQDAIGGLQVLSPSGAWIDATPVEGAFVVNIGDMMARWTNDRYRATKHRVLNAAQTDRYSIPFFVEPNYDTPVETIASCLAPGEAPRYDPVVSGEYLMSRFAATYEHVEA